MATQVRSKSTGEIITLYDPAEKSMIYAAELGSKTKANGEKLTKSQASYRMGYLNARKDNARAYKYNKRKGR